MKSCLSFSRGGRLLAAALLAVTSTAIAANPLDVVHVEEDWELVLGEPDSNSVGPQIACTMSPFNNISDTFFTLEINHRSAPYWTPGGLTIHQWSGDWRIQSLDRTDRTVMQTNSETVSWTQVLDVQGGGLTFQVKAGESTTWGQFGHSNFFKLRTGWGVDNINSYTPTVSVEQSGIAYAGNRVRSLKLKEVRATLRNGATVTDSTVRVAHQLVE